MLFLILLEIEGVEDRHNSNIMNKIDLCLGLGKNAFIFDTVLHYSENFQIRTLGIHLLIPRVIFGLKAFTVCSNDTPIERATHPYDVQMLVCVS